MIHLENEHLSVIIHSQAARLQSVVDQSTGHEFISSPQQEVPNPAGSIYFPYLQGGQSHTYRYNQKDYQYFPYGFARVRDFHLQTQTDTSATFYLKNQPEDRSYYPFDFSLQISYTLHGPKITVSYEVLNPTLDMIYYCLGSSLSVKVTPHEDEQEFESLTLDVSPKGHYLHIPYEKDLINQSSGKYEWLENLTLKWSTFQIPQLYRMNHQTQVTLMDASGAQIHVTPQGMDFLNLRAGSEDCQTIYLELFAGAPQDQRDPSNFPDMYGVYALDPHGLGLHDYTLTFHKY